MSIHDKETDSIQPEMAVDPDKEAGTEIQNQTDFPLFLAELHKMVKSGEIVKVEGAIAERLHRLGVMAKDVDNELADEKAKARERSDRGELQGGVVNRVYGQRGDKANVEQSDAPHVERREQTAAGQPVDHSLQVDQRDSRKPAVNQDV